MNGASIALCVNDSAKGHQEQLDTGGAIMTQDLTQRSLLTQDLRRGHYDPSDSLVTDVIVNGHPCLRDSFIRITQKGEDIEYSFCYYLGYYYLLVD